MSTTSYSHLPAGFMEHNRLLQNLYAFLTAATDPLSGLVPQPSLAPLVDEARSVVESYKALSEAKPPSPPPAERSGLLSRSLLAPSTAAAVSGDLPSSGALKKRILTPLLATSTPHNISSSSSHHNNSSRAVAAELVPSILTPQRSTQQQCPDTASSPEISISNVSAVVMTSSTLLNKCHPRNYLLAACRARSPREMVMMLERANAEGSLLASIELGAAFALGYGCDAAIGLGLEMLDIGVSLGHPGAMLTVSRCLREGIGVPVDEVTGNSWLQTAAEANYAPAQHELGELYETGPEVDLGLALRWYKRAASLGYPPSQLNLAKMLFTAAQVDLGDILALQPEAVPSLGELGAKARYWLSMASEGGSVEARQLMERVGAISTM